MSANDHNTVQLIDSIETYAYGMSRYLVCKKSIIIIKVTI